MKTVTGTIVSSKQVSVSKAASILSKFVSAETGASQAVNAYLRRATAAVDELARLHGKSDRRKHKNREPDAAAASAATNTIEESHTRRAEPSRGESTQYRSELSHGVDAESKDLKKKHNKEKDSGFVNSGNDESKMAIEVKDVQSNGGINLEEEIERKKQLKKEKMGIELKEEKGQGEINLGEENERKKHKKKGRKEIEVKEEQGNGESILGEESERKKHKRKREKGDVGDTDRNRGDIRDKEEEKVEKDDALGRLENGSQMGIGEKKEERKEKKKRKSREMEEEMGEGSEERPTKKKKKRRSGEEYD